MTEPNFSAIRARLRYDSVDEFIDGYSRYVTAGGMFIPMTPAKLKPVGTTVRFQFVLGDGATALLGEGIVRQIRGLESEDADSPIGMLVKFTKLSQTSKVLIDRIIALKEVEKLGVDLQSGEASEGGFSELDGIESGVQEATTGSYSVAELANSIGGKAAANEEYESDEDDEDLGAMFTERTGRLEASELAGLGASNFSDKLADPTAEREVVSEPAKVKNSPQTARPTQDWGPEPEDEEVDTAGSGELSLDLLGFGEDDFSLSASADLFSKEDASSNELSFDFAFEPSEPSEPVADEALDFPAFSVDSGSEDVLEEEVVEVERDDSGDEAVAPRVVRETLGGLQIHSFDGSADASVDRDFEQFALGSDDDVDSMFDDVFGDAFGGAFGDSDDSSDDEPADDGVVEFAAPEIVEEVAKPVETFVGLDEFSAEIEALGDAGVLSGPALMQPAVPNESENAEEIEEDGLAALLFGDESESDSDDFVIEEVEGIVEPAAFELESDLAELSDNLADIEDNVAEVGADVSEELFSLEESDVEDDVVAEIPPPPAVSEFELSDLSDLSASTAAVAEVENDSAAHGVEASDENSSELLSLLGALEDSEVEEDGGLSLGKSLSLSHGLNAPSSPVLDDDEPDSLSALLASAQKELEARTAVSEEDRQRDAIDELLGDDELPLPNTMASPFAVPEIGEKKRKGFMSKLFGKD